MNALLVLVAGDNSGAVAGGLGEAQYLSALIGVVLPILVGLVTKYSTSSSVKAVLLLALSATSSFLTEWQADENFVFSQALFGTVLTFVTAVAMRFGLWKQTVEPAAQRSLNHD